MAAAIPSTRFQMNLYRPILILLYVHYFQMTVEHVGSPAIIFLL
ncbi:hypothetical protein FHX11_003217 [Rhizobium sp. BK602]|nr:hypothetical protein [Rhizobium sp. BK602]